MKILGSGEPNFRQSADRQKLGSLDCVVAAMGWLFMWWVTLLFSVEYLLDDDDDDDSALGSVVVFVCIENEKSRKCK